MQVKIIYDQTENEYIAFLEGFQYAGYGTTEQSALYDFLTKCVDNPKFNQSVVSLLLDKLKEC